MRKRLLIIEGFDGCGKTTLANNILAKRPAKYVKNNYEGDIAANIKRGLSVLHAVSEGPDNFVIFDRFHGISDPVLDTKHEYAIEHNVLHSIVHYMQHRELDIKVIWLYSTEDEIRTHLASRGKAVPLETHLMDNFENCTENAEAVLQRYRAMGIPVYMIFIPIYSEAQTLENVLSIIDNWEEKTCK